MIQEGGRPEVAGKALSVCSRGHHLGLLHAQPQSVPQPRLPVPVPWVSSLGHWILQPRSAAGTSRVVKRPVRWCGNQQDGRKITGFALGWFAPPAGRMSGWWCSLEHFHAKETGTTEEKIQGIDNSPRESRRHAKSQASTE